MPTNSRDLHGPTQSRAIRDLFQSLFVAELINPSPKLWLFFAWISDVEILDNSARQFAVLEPDWPSGTDPAVPGSASAPFARRSGSPDHP